MGNVTRLDCLRSDYCSLRLMALGFGIGSALFAAGAVMALASWGPANTTYALGAVFFTLAALVQWRSSVRHSAGHHGHAGAVEWDLRSADWWSAIVQFVGTLYFNVMTIAALTVAPLSAAAFDAKVWTPDVYGSTLFLASSLIALAAESRERRHALIPERSKLIVWSNLFGSAMFGVSAVTGKAVEPGVLVDPGLSNITTLLGALGFLIAAALTWPPPRATHPTVQ